MMTRDTTIVNKLGLHARAATRLVNCASAFESESWITKGDKRVNGKSIMGVLTLAAGKGSSLILETIGADEELAMNALIDLIADRFGEDE